MFRVWKDGNEGVGRKSKLLSRVWSVYLHNGELNGEEQTPKPQTHNEVEAGMLKRCRV